MISKALAWLLGYALPALLLLAGLAGLSVSVGGLVDAWASPKWPLTTGTVMRSELGSETVSKQSADSTQYWAEVEYEYEVEGRAFRGSSITLDGLRSGFHVGTGKAEAESILARYPMGAQVDVHYKPSAPERAALQTGVAGDGFFVPLFSLVLIFISASWLWFMLSSRSGGSGQEEQWRGKPRTCPECRTPFTSVQDKGVCPKCGHVFLASEVMGFPGRVRPV